MQHKNTVNDERLRYIGKNKHSNMQYDSVTYDDIT